MTADTLEELHEMAEKLGLRRWFQNTGTPHYDLCKSKRLKAIKLGAIPEGVLEGARRRLEAKRKGQKWIWMTPMSIGREAGMIWGNIRTSLSKRTPSFAYYWSSVSLFRDLKLRNGWEIAKMAGTVESKLKKSAPEKL
jgi:hypothetical protein